MNIAIYLPKTNQLKIYTKNGIIRETSGLELILDEDIIMVESLSLMSKDQLSDLLDGLSLETFPKLAIEDSLSISIVFFDENKQLIYACDPVKGFVLVGKQELDILSPQVGYIEKASLITAKQLIKIIKKEWVPTELKSYNSKEYIHTKHDGTVLIGDIEINGSPLKLEGKYNFIDISSIGKEKLFASAHFRILLKKEKIEIVNDEYVQKNKHKHKQPLSGANTIPVGSVSDFVDQDQDNDENVIFIEGDTNE